MDRWLAYVLQAAAAGRPRGSRFGVVLLIVYLFNRYRWTFKLYFQFYGIAVCNVPSDLYFLCSLLFWLHSRLTLWRVLTVKCYPQEVIKGFFSKVESCGGKRLTNSKQRSQGRLSLLLPGNACTGERPTYGTANPRIQIAQVHNKYKTYWISRSA